MVTPRGDGLSDPRDKIDSVLDRSEASEFRRDVRERTLALAHEQVLLVGWDQLRVGKIASEIGVSRPTIYAEFGNKDGIARALVAQQTQRYLTGVTDRLSRYSDEPVEAFRVAMRYTFAEARRDPLLRAILVSSESAGDPMLPRAVTRDRPVFYIATETLFEWSVARYPTIPVEPLRDVIDTLVRLVISHLVFAGPRPTKVIHKLTDVAECLYRDQLGQP